MFYTCLLLGTFTISDCDSYLKIHEGASNSCDPKQVIAQHNGFYFTVIQPDLDEVSVFTVLGRQQQQNVLDVLPYMSASSMMIQSYQKDSCLLLTFFIKDMTQMVFAESPVHLNLERQYSKKCIK